MENSPIEILVIEDDVDQARLIRGLLSESRKPEFSVQLVRNLTVGLSLLRSRDFDVILIDLGLPDSQGLETALTVRNQARHVPIVVLTAFDDEETALKALQSDIQDYLIKGEITFSLLKRSIRYAIQRKLDIEAQRQCKDHFASFIHNIPVAAWMKDLDGRYVQSNAEQDRNFAIPFSQYLARPTRNSYRWISPGDFVRTTHG